MIHDWETTTSKDKLMSIPEKLGTVFANVGPSIAVTSITNCLAFGIGAFTPTPAIQRTCTAASLAIAIDFVCQFTFFAAILAISGRRETKTKNV